MATLSVLKFDDPYGAERVMIALQGMQEREMITLEEVSISDDCIKEVRDKVTEGTSPLFALTSGATAVDKVVEELKRYDFEIISTNLPEEQEQKLREAFAYEG
jgi:uncharacterized membrane protein